MNFLELKNISKIYKQNGYEHQVLDHISFTMEKGHCLGIVGESGSGKSTLAKIIMGLSDVTSGQIIYEGWEIQNLKEKERKEFYKKVQLAFQDVQNSFDPHWKLYDSIAEGLFNKGISKKDAKDMIKRFCQKVELDEHILFHYPAQVSGGQCSRAALLRALVLEPQLLILDEVTSSLDGIVIIQIIELIEKLQKEMELSVILICHDLGIVQRLCDDVLVMKQGKIIEQGRVADIIERPQHPYTRLLIESSF